MSIIHLASSQAKADVRDLHSDPHGDLKTCLFVSVFLEGVMKASIYINNVSTKKCLSLVN